MNKPDTKEATPLLQRAIEALLEWSPTRGKAGANLRTQIGYLHAFAERLVQRDAAGEPLDQCYQLAVLAGITQTQLSWVRQRVTLESPTTIGATMMKHSIIYLNLATEAQVIAAMTFTSREDVELLKQQLGEAFREVAEIAADAMDQMTFRALVNLHGAVVFHLIETGRPLPRMLRWQFAAVMSSLMVAQRLYYDASRADELRKENKVVHPAFMLPHGRALSA